MINDISELKIGKTYQVGYEGYNNWHEVFPILVNADENPIGSTERLTAGDQVTILDIQEIFASGGRRFKYAYMIGMNKKFIGWTMIESFNPGLRYKPRNLIYHWSLRE